MTLLVRNIEIAVDDITTDKKLLKETAKKLQIDVEDINFIEIKKKSLDARKKSRPKYIYQAYVKVNNESKVLEKNQNHAVIVDLNKNTDPLAGLDLDTKQFSKMPVIIGSGPSGIFCALLLAYAGQPSIIVERGEPVETRQKTSNRLRRKGEFNSESNFCFGEGGAGTFSDGKLTCGRNHPLVEFLFKEWVKYGAPKEILYDAHPHIGTDNLTLICINMRKYLEKQGCKFLFNTKFTDFEKTNNTYTVKFENRDSIDTEHLILAIGHSARETYWKLYEKGVEIAPKPFAVGARFEHPQDLINEIQFGKSACFLPSAEYKLAAQVKDRGIWTFCMCPGGHLMPTNAQKDHLAINGMSYHNRSSGFANAAVVVNVRKEDYFTGHPMDGIKFQENIEQAAFQAGGSNYFTPAQRLGDFIKGKISTGKMNSTYKPGLTPARLDKVLPNFISDALKLALTDYDKRMRGYISEQGLVVGVESKTSAPIVFGREKNFQSSNFPGLYPIGEGAGYAGGIVSASLDGVRAAKSILTNRNT